MMAFLLWARQICEHQNLKQMMFLANAGELPLKMARAMPEDHWPSTTLHHLHCSQELWSVASASVVGVDDWITLGTTDQHAFLRHREDSLPVTKLLERIGVSPEQAAMTPFFSDVDLSVALPENEADRWHNFLADGAIQQTISDHSARQKKGVVKALRQSDISLSSVPALVDIGWRGQQSWMVSALFQEALDIDPLHLHFAGVGVSDLIDSKIHIRRFAFDDSVQPSPIDNAVACLKMFLSVGQPRLIGYSQDEQGTVVKKFSRLQQECNTPTSRQVWNGACTLAASLPSRSECEALGFGQAADLSAQTRQLLDMFWNSPDPDEMKLLTGLRIEIDNNGTIVHPVITPFTTKELMGKPSPHRVWNAGSLAGTPQPVRAAVAAFKKAKTIVD